jgi:hypothetical protein
VRAFAVTLVNNDCGFDATAPSPGHLPQSLPHLLGVIAFATSTSSYAKPPVWVPIPLRKMANNSVPHLRQPAARVGGQRRRLSRAQRPPRLNTMPNLHAESSSSGSNSNVGAGRSSEDDAAATSAEEGAASFGASHSMMNLRMRFHIQIQLLNSYKHRSPWRYPRWTSHDIP